MRIKIIRTALALLFVSLILISPRAQPATATSSTEDRANLYQALLDLTNPWTVMCVAAHPDDEDGASLIVMRRKFGAHTVSLFSTFGEGGQNAIGPELYEELGAIRARETMAAAEILGSEPHFLGLKDFGYSKSPEEAFKIWGHDEALRRIVLEIRRLRPDVIITNHSVTNNDHGHHQATARLVVEAFAAAADPRAYPEQLKDGVSTWQVRRLFVRARGNQNQADNAPVVTIDPNELDPVRGATFAEQALSALQKHATQGPWPKTVAQLAARFGNNPDGRWALIRYRLVREADGVEGIPKDSHNFLDGLKLREEVAKEVAVPTLTGSLADLAGNRLQALSQLIEGFHRGDFGVPIEHPVDSSRRARMKSRVERAFAVAAGISFVVHPSTAVVIPDSTLDVSIKILNSGAEPANFFGCDSSTGSSPPASNQPRERIAPGAILNRLNKVRITAGTAINIPVADHLYEPSGLGLELNTRCVIELSGAKFGIDLPRRVDVAAPVEIAQVTPSPAALSPAKANDPSPQARVSFSVTLINHQAVPFNGHLQAADLFGTPINELPVTLAVGETKTTKLAVTRPATGFAHSSIIVIVEGAKFSASQKSVAMFSTEARVAPNLRVGYIRGFDYSLPNALNALEVESKELSVEDVKTAELQKYTSIIVDNRAYELTPGLISVNQRLLDYAKDGGTLIVFYHKSNEWNPDERRNRPQLAPYSLTLGDERITDENAPITFLESDHPLLNTPNQMRSQDFVAWIQERGLYYPKEWDAHYHALLQSNDPGEAPLKGGLLVADYGRGHYIYTSMVWYRELRAGAPGAYRMLANMISLGH